MIIFEERIDTRFPYNYRSAGGGSSRCTARGKSVGSPIFRRFSSLRGRKNSARLAINECARTVIRSVRLGTCPSNESILGGYKEQRFIHALANDRLSEFIMLTAELHSRCGRRIASSRLVVQRCVAVIKKFRDVLSKSDRTHRVIQLSSKRPG